MSTAVVPVSFAAVAAALAAGNDNLALAVPTSKAVTITSGSDTFTLNEAGLYIPSGNTLYINNIGMTSAPTANAPMIRDANGRVEVASPSTDTQADTQGARNTAIASAIAGIASGPYYDMEAFANGVTISEGVGSNTYGYYYVAMASGKYCTGARIRITSAGSVTLRVSFGTSSARSEFQDIAHSAGTSSHTITWASGGGPGGSWAMTKGLPYYIGVWETGGAKGYTLNTAINAIGAPLAVWTTSWFPVASNIVAVATRRSNNDVIPAFDSAVALPYTGLFA